MTRNDAASPSEAQASIREAYEERAAIMEFDGGLTREAAEAAARAAWPYSAW